LPIRSNRIVFLRGSGPGKVNNAVPKTFDFFCTGLRVRSRLRVDDREGELPYEPYELSKGGEATGLAPRTPFH
jgi:hypothetical protein